MDPESPILHFAEFYFSPLMSRKGVELIKLGLMKPPRQGTEPELIELGALKRLSQLIAKRRKSLFSDEELLSTLPSDLRELYALDPEEVILLATQAPFQLPVERIAHAFGSPVDSLRFRIRHLLHRLEDSGIDLAAISVRNETLPEVRASLSRPGHWLESFRGLPAGLRFSVESAAILSVLLALLWLIPEIRNRYENSIQKRINDYLIESSLLDAPAPEGTSKTPRAPLDVPQEQEPGEETAFPRSSSEAPSARKQPKVNAGETWRFSFTGSATHEIEGGILEVLKAYPSDQTRPLTVPGGIQFDFMLATDQLVPLKNRLEQLVADLQSKTSAGKPGGINLVNMSWYKKKNMGTRRIPDAHVQVIVWISTL